MAIPLKHETQAPASTGAAGQQRADTPQRAERERRGEPAPRGSEHGQRRHGFTDRADK